jgi:hypothetical protein
MLAPSPDGGASFCEIVPRGAVVLRKLSKEISECYRLAEQAREWAEQATDPRIRQDYLSVERFKPNMRFLPSDLGG